MISHTKNSRLENPRQKMEQDQLGMRRKPYIISCNENIGYTNRHAYARNCLYQAIFQSASYTIFNNGST